MATMNRSTRLFGVVHLLAGRTPRSIDEIAERFGISVRTAYRDLADLSEQHVPIYHDEHGYKLMETATLKPLNLTTEEHALLKVALHNPALRHQPSLLHRLEALEMKLDAAIAMAEESPQALQLAAIDRSGPQAKDALEPLRLAIQKRQSVQIQYHSLSGSKKRWRGLDPWQVFQRSEAWYLVGHCHENSEPRTFRLDRIGGVRGLDKTYEIPDDFRLESHLQDSWKLIKGEGSYDVVLHFDPSLAPLILNARHHPGEEATELPDGTIEYR
ncbi:MAG: WYL domain-containing protein, partial [Thermoanaerobaculia bacterium]